MTLAYFASVESLRPHIVKIDSCQLREWRTDLEIAEMSMMPLLPPQPFGHLPIRLLHERLHSS